MLRDFVTQLEWEEGVQAPAHLIKNDLKIRHDA
jgi:hypothetical protein